jgi:hypothetical protein
MQLAQLVQARLIAFYVPLLLLLFLFVLVPGGEQSE